MRPLSSQKEPLGLRLKDFGGEGYVHVPVPMAFHKAKKLKRNSQAFKWQSRSISSGLKRGQYTVKCFVSDVTL